MAATDQFFTHLNVQPRVSRSLGSTGEGRTDYGFPDATRKLFTLEKGIGGDEIL